MRFYYFNMRLLCVLFSTLLAYAVARDCSILKKSTSKLFCYYSKVKDINDCYCSHIILPANSDIKSVETVREYTKDGKILVTVNEFNEGLVDLLKTNKVDGLEIKLNKLNSKNDINDFISTVRSKLGSNLYLAISLPAKPESLAKYYDFKGLSKYADAFILQTAFLGASKNVTFHPSRLSGLWDMQNTDSMVDLIGGLGAPLSKVVITAPVQAFHFTLQNEEYSAPGSPALDLRSLTRDELCKEMKNGENWTMERDEDQAGTYIFSKNKWIAFEDTTSIDIKTKYSRVRGLAGLALKDVSQDGGEKCSNTILQAAFNGLSKQARAPRGALLHSLEREILETPINTYEGISQSPYRITRIIDVEGHWHVVRQDTRTEFTCSRQGYFVHPRSCNRFYRCVKFDQLSDEYSVFEFDCPAGLAFDERVEVCVWPGSLPKGQPCSGSSEIAPVPRQRFSCPHEQGYYADPENCRWFFACLDHGKSALEAYEFRCPFGLVFDADHLMCEWPWLVPKCGSGINYGINLATDYHQGYSVNPDYSATVLDQYDGIGALGIVKLGGYSGHIQPPIIYSNVGLGSYNNGGLNRLGAKTTGTLYNAGLLKPTPIISINNYNTGSSSDDSNSELYGVTQGYQYNKYSTGSANSFSYSNIEGKSDATNGNIGGYSNAFGNSNSQFVNIHPTVTAGLGSTRTTNIYNGNIGSYINEPTINDKIVHTDAGHNEAIVGINVNDYIATNNVDLKHENYENKNNILEQKYVTGNTGHLYEYNNNVQGLHNNINIIGGGFSAVGNLSPHVDTDSIIGITASTTPIPISLTTYASVPTVTSVPVPIVSSPTGFEKFSGGVIANIPELQYKVHGQTGLNNISTNFVNFISTTALPAVVKTERFGYDQNPVAVVTESYQRPLIAIQQTFNHNNHSRYDSGASFNYQSQQYDQNGGYVYPKPVLVFEEDQYLSAKPAVHLEQSQYNVNTGYVYSKPNIPVEETPIYSTPSTFVVQQNVPRIVPVEPIHTVQSIAPVVGQKTVIQHDIGYSYPKPAIPFEETPVVYKHTSPKLIQPIISTEQRIHHDTGYVYPKPSIPFEENPIRSTSAPVIVQQNVQHVAPVQSIHTVFQQKTITQPDTGYSYPKPLIPFEETPKLIQPIISTEQRIDHDNGYVYSKPSIPFEQIPIRSTPATVFAQHNVQHVAAIQSVQTVQSVKPIVEQKTVIQPIVQKDVGYSYPKPAIPFEETPLVYQQPSPKTIQPIIPAEQNIKYDTGYVYPKPSIAFEETPIRSTPATLSVQTVHHIVPVQTIPTVQPHITIQKDTGYIYPKPKISFEETPHVLYHSTISPIFEEKVHQAVSVQSVAPVQLTTPTYRYVSSTTVKPSVYPELQQVVHPQPQISIAEPVVQRHFPRIISKFTITNPLVQQKHYESSISDYKESVESKFDGYHYEAPELQFREKPVKSTVIFRPNLIQSTPAPSLVTYPEVTAKPAVVSSYYYQNPAVSRYTYKDVVQKITERPIAAVVPTYSPVTDNPNLTIQTYQQNYQSVVPTTPTPAIYYNNIETSSRKPAISSYNYVTLSTSKPYVYVNNQPAVEFEGYDYPKPDLTFNEEPKSFVPIYDKKPVEEVPFVKKKAYITGQTYNVKPKIGPVIVENYKAPFLINSENEYEGNIYSQINKNTFSDLNVNVISSTPRPTFKSTVLSITPTVQPSTEASKFYFYDSRLSTKSGTVVNEGYSYPKPQIKFEEKQIITSTYLPPPSNEYLPVTSTPHFERKPIITSTYLPPPIKEYLPVTSTTSKPIVDYSYNSLTNQNDYSSSYDQDIVSAVTYEPLKTETKLFTPISTYSPIDITSQSYVPIRSKVKYATPQLSETYLPVRTVSTVAPIQTSTLSKQYLPVRLEEELISIGNIDVTSKRPTKVVKIVRPIKTVIKQNDFIPMLSAKLGAQCTCTSNTLSLRKKQKIIVVEDDDNDDDDGYAVENYSQGTVIENYSYEPQKVVDITPTPQVYIKSTSENIIVPTSGYIPRKQIRVRPLISVENDITPSDKEIANAVRTGLKLVKQAAKEGAREGAEEALNNHNSRIRETIECQRAGLFRHPNHCNKFYACRWDCTKNKYTLHTFNCPVHLTFDNSLGACNWPSQGPACADNTLLPTARV